MGAPIIFSGNNAKLLKPNLDFGLLTVNSGSLNPTVTAVNANVGSLYLSSATGRLYQKNDSGLSINWSILPFGNSSDISDTLYAVSNNISTPTPITSFAFSTVNVRSFDARVSVAISATSSLFESFSLHGIRNNSGWQLAVSSVGDNSQINFSINSSGQVLYTSGNYAGFTSASLHFRATTLGV